MRVLYWPELHLPYIGGAEVLSAHFLPEMRRRGHELLVLTSHGDRELPDEEEIDGIPIVRMHFRGILESRDVRGLARAARRVAELKRSFRPDLIHIHFSGPSTLFHLHSASASDAPTLVTVHHNVSADPSGGNLGSRVLRDAFRVVTVSEAIARQVEGAVPALAGRTRVIHNGLALPARDPGPLPFDPPRLLAFGRLIPEKGFDVALQAFATLQRETPALELVVAGDGPERARLEQLAKDLALEVSFPGWVDPDEIPALIDRATLVLVPSTFAEPFGLVAVQAGQMARPVVATRRGGLPEIVSDGESGILFEAGDHDAAAAALGRLLRDPELAARMGRAGRARARRHFSIDAYADAYEALYRECLGQAVESGDEP